MLFPSITLPRFVQLALQFILLLFIVPVCAQNLSTTSIIVELNRWNLTQLNFLPGFNSGGKAMMLSGGAGGGGGGGNDWGGGSGELGQWIIKWPITPEQPRKQSQSASTDGNKESPPDTQRQESKESWMYDSSPSGSEPSSSAGGGERNPDQGASISEVALDGLFEELEVLMNQLPADVQLTILSDFDDTLFPGRLEDSELEKRKRERFRSFVNRWRAQGKLKLIIVTHNSLASAADFYEPCELPLPDYVISGCTMGRSLEVRRLNAERFQCEIMPLPSGPSIITVEPTGFRINQNYITFLEFSAEVQADLQSRGIRIVSAVDSSTDDESIVTMKSESPLLEGDRKLIRARLFANYGVLARVSFIGDHEFVVALPISKGAIVSRFADAMGLLVTRVMAVGDTVDDISMMRPLSFSSYQADQGVIVRGSELAQAGLDGRQGQALFVGGTLITGVVQGMLRWVRKILEEEQVTERSSAQSL